MPKYTLEDGRVFTDYNSSSYLNEMIRNKYKIENDSHAYRYFLQKNGTKIIKDLKECLTDYDACPVCKNIILKK